MLRVLVYAIVFNAKCSAIATRHCVTGNECTIIRDKFRNRKL